MGSLSLLQWIFLTQESNWGLLHCRWILYQLSSGKPWCPYWVLTLEIYFVIQVYYAHLCKINYLCWSISLNCNKFYMFFSLAFKNELIVFQCAPALMAFSRCDWHYIPLLAVFPRSFLSGVKTRVSIRETEETDQHLISLAPLPPTVAESSLLSQIYLGAPWRVHGASPPCSMCHDDIHCSLQSPSQAWLKVKLKITLRV